MSILLPLVFLLLWALIAMLGMGMYFGSADTFQELSAFHDSLNSLFAAFILVAAVLVALSAWFAPKLHIKK